jgi:hypothetical protein
MLCDSTQSVTQSESGMIVRILKIEKIMLISLNPCQKNYDFVRMT